MTTGVEICRFGEKSMSKKAKRGQKRPKNNIFGIFFAFFGIQKIIKQKYDLKKRF